MEQSSSPGNYDNHQNDSLSQAQEIQDLFEDFGMFASPEYASYFPQSIFDKLKKLFPTTNEAYQFRFRTIFRNFLLITPHWNDVHQYLLTLDANHLYGSSQEVALYNEWQKKYNEKNKLIEDARDATTFAWYNSIEVNEKSPLYPYIVGVYRNGKNEMQMLYGQRYFTSKRNLPEQLFGGTGWNEEKQINLLTTERETIQNVEILPSPYWQLLPSKLRRIFENNQILITGKSNLYDLSERDRQMVVSEEKVDALQRFLESRLAQTNEDYFLLTISDFPSGVFGRNGILMEKGRDGNIEPIIIIIHGIEFCVEVKGCGSVQGGFSRTHRQTERTVVTGGVERIQAINEYEFLNKKDYQEGPLVAGSILFDKEMFGETFRQGYIIRLIPSTVRGSFADNVVFPQVKKETHKYTLIDLYSQSFINELFEIDASVIDRSSHIENLLLWGKNSYRFTDFSDHTFLGSHNIPIPDTSWGYVTQKIMLYAYIRMFDEIPGNKMKQEVPYFFKKLSSALSIDELNFDFNSLNLPSSSDEWYSLAQKVTDIIWEKIMAYKVIQSKVKEKYFPKSIYEYICFNVQDIFPSLISLPQNDFIYQFKKSNISEAESVFLQLQKLLFDDDDALPSIEKLYANIWRNYRNGFDCNNVLLLVRHFFKYYAYEKSLFQIVQKSRLGNEKLQVRDAIQSIYIKVEQLKQIYTSPLFLYTLLHDQEKIQELLLIDFYNSDTMS